MQPRFKQQQQTFINMRYTIFNFRHSGHSAFVIPVIAGNINSAFRSLVHSLFRLFVIPDPTRLGNW